MKTVSNTLRLTAMAASISLALSFVVIPVSSYGLNVLRSSTATAAKSSAFCTNLSTKANAATGSMTNLTGKLSQAWTTQDQKISDAYQNVDAKVTTARQNADTERATNFTMLEANASTDTQKQAVKAYEASVLQAVSVRRGAFDAARQTFRSGVQAAVSARHNTVSTQLSSFNSTVQSALGSAQTACASDPSGTTRVELVASLKSARETFQASRKTDATVGSQVKTLAADRNAAFKTATQTFEASMKTARETLQNAFGSTNV